MADMLSLCALLLAHAFTATAFSLGAGSIPSVGSLPHALPGMSGLPNKDSSDAGFPDFPVGPLDPVLGALDPTDVLSPAIDALVGSPMFALSPALDLSDAGLVEVLSSPLGLGVLTSELSAHLVGALGNLTEVVVPDSIAYGPPPDEEARRFGLKSERHRLTTPDNYVLTVFRISSACTRPDRVVILTTSAFMNSASFILLQQESLAYKLAWQCNDVWIVPFRGPRWAAENTKLDYYSPEFFNSTILELGIYDLRVGIEFVSDCTGSNSIRLIASDIMASAYVAMNAKLGDDSPQCRLGHVYLVEPLICMQHTQSFFFAGLKLFRDVMRIGTYSTLHNVIPFGEDPLHRSMSLLGGVLSPETVNLVQKLYFGPTNSLDTKAFRYAAKYVANNLQVPVAAQIVQNMRSARCLCEFDFGKTRNLELYNSEEPPPYDITASIATVSIYVNEKSTLSGREDWQTTYESFPPSARRRLFVIQDGNILTLFLAKNPDTFFYNKLLADMEEDYRDDGIAACTKPCRSCR